MTVLFLSSIHSFSKSCTCSHHFSHNFTLLTTHCLLTTLHRGSDHRSCFGIQESCHQIIWAETFFHESSLTIGANWPYDATLQRGIQCTTAANASFKVMIFCCIYSAILLNPDSFTISASPASPHQHRDHYLLHLRKYK